MNSKEKDTKNIISFVIIIVLIILLIFIYNKYDFNNFSKSVREKCKTNFSRDSEVKYSNIKSYKIENKEYNDAMFFQTLDVSPNKAYRVTCMVKTENVTNLDGLISAGAQICIADTTERSINITGTSDWTKIEFMFNSKNRESVNIGFRLGGYAHNEKVQGTAWFSDFKIEVGSTDKSNEWKFGCFIFNGINVITDKDGQYRPIKTTIKTIDKEYINDCMNRFKTSCEIMTKNKINLNYDIIQINDTIKTISYDEENGYYVDEVDVYGLIDQYVQQNNYDHIFVVIKLGDANKFKKTNGNDWIGLGGMNYLGTGFSNIRIFENSNDYRYNYKTNPFPEEVFIHEFLHTLERNSKEYGYETPLLHDYEKYGYRQDTAQGLKLWYTDYMNYNINTSNGKIGLPEQIYTLKPVTKEDFNYSYELDVFKDPKNIIEIINNVIKRVGKLFSSSDKIIDGNNIYTNTQGEQ